MHTVLLSILFLLCSNAALSVDYDQLVDQLCPKDKVECCKNRMRANQPLNCSDNSQENLLVAMKIERAAHPSSTLLGMTNCCEVFRHDNNDPDEVCLSKCNNMETTPTFNHTIKMARIQECRLENPLFNCFKQCLAADGLFDVHNCGAWHKLKPGDSVPLEYSPKFKRL